MTQESNASPPQIANTSEVVAAAFVDPNVNLACQLMWWYFAAGVIALITELVNIPDASTFPGIVSAVGLFFSAITFALVHWGTSRLRAGRNWMRLLITSVSVLGLITIPLFWDLYRDDFLRQLSHPPAAVATATQRLLGLSAVVLINTRSARNWFKALAQGPVHAA